MGIKMLIKKFFVSKCVILKNKKHLRCENFVSIDNNSFFEGNNFLGEYVKIEKSSMGYGTYIASNSKIFNSQIGRYTCIANNVEIIRGTHPSSRFVSVHPAFFSEENYSAGFSYVNKQKFIEREFIDSEKEISVVVGNDVWIGYGAKIVEGITIGNGAVVAAGAIVTKDVPPYAIVGGVPAKVIKYRFSEEDIEFLLRLCWWDKSEEWIKEYAEYFEDIELLKQQLRDEK